MTMGEWLLNEMKPKSRIKALIAFNKREEIRKNIALYFLLILLTTYVVLEFKAILSDTRMVYIEVTHAEVVKAATEVTSDEGQVIETRQAGEISNESTQQLITRIAKEEGFEDVQLLLDLAMCESSMGTKTINYNNDKRKTIDRGTWMVNSYWHSEVTDEQAYNNDWSTRWTIDRIKKGYGYEWMCWKK